MESKRKVQTEEAQQYAKDSDIIHMETSAKTATNVRDLFIEIGEHACHTQSVESTVALLIV